MNTFKRRSVLSVLVLGLALSLLLSSCALQEEPGPVMRTGPGQGAEVAPKETPTPAAPPVSAAPAPETPAPVTSTPVETGQPESTSEDTKEVSLGYVSFTVPSNWQIISAQDPEGRGEYYSIASPLDSDGTATSVGVIKDMLFTDRSAEEEVQNVAAKEVEAGTRNIVVEEITVPGAEKAWKISGELDYYIQNLDKTVRVSAITLIIETGDGFVMAHARAKGEQSSNLQIVLNSAKVN